MTEKNKFHMRLPRDGREFLLFLLIVSLISVNIIAPLIAMMSVGFEIAVWLNVVKILPIMWIIVMVLVILTNKPARWITNKIILPTDSFNAHIIVELIFNVLLMSIILTVVGSKVAQWNAGWISPLEYIHVWPRNFAISFAVESLIAQPVAHFVMHHYHLRKDSIIS